MSTNITVHNPYVNPYAFTSVSDGRAQFVNHLMGLGDLNKLKREKRNKPFGM